MMRKIQINKIEGKQKQIAKPKGHNGVQLKSRTLLRGKLLKTHTAERTF